MTSEQPIKALFARDIYRRIEEVIKVDQADEEIIRDEIDEYVVTDTIRRHYIRILEEYRRAPNNPREGIAIWVSGFFGSGKSSFAKMLGLSIQDRIVEGEPAGERFAERARDNQIQVLLRAINEHIPTHAVIFDVSTDRGIRSGNQTLTEIMYGLFLQSLGYAKDLDLSELEISLEEKGELARFEQEYGRLLHKDWSREKGKIAFALSEASRVMHSLDPETYPAADSWVKAVKNKADITPGKLAQRATELMNRRRPGQALMFVVDEVGQFVARDVQKMLDLQAIVQRLGVIGRGRHWVVVTSQEKLGELVSGLDDKKIELARLMDRFPLQVHLEPSDISEVTSRRVLLKNAPAQQTLGALFEEHRGRLVHNTRLTADIKLPELTRESFVDLYPLLPYQIDLIIQVVSGLRTQAGASRHVGGANRTIIKLAQQLLINRAVDMADQPVGALVRLDQVYDLVEENISSEIRAKIAAIPRELNHPFAQRVAKVICLLQNVKSVHSSDENIAAALVPEVGSDSPLASVKEALRELEAAHKVRRGDDGYRIPTPAEDDWELVRNGISPKPGDAHRLYAEILASFWQPQPSYTLFDTKTFKAGLAIHGRNVTSGDLTFQFHLADEGSDFESLANELRGRSQQERRHVFWAVPLDNAIDHEIVEVFRSREMLARKERETRSEDTRPLLAEEGLRQRQHQDQLRRLLRAACLAGRVYFRGHDRSPDDRAVEVSKTAAEILGQVLPDVFDRFQEAAAKVNDVRRGTDAIFTAQNLRGLPQVFSQLNLLRDENGQTVFRVDSGPLREVLDRIDERANYGETASGRYLADEFANEPFGWDFEVVRLLVLALMRAEKIEATSKAESVKSNETSGCLRGLWWLVLLGAGCGRFVDPRVGRHLARPGAAVEPPGVGSVGGVEGGGAAGFDGDPGSVVHRCWGVHRDPGMPVLIIVVPEEVAAEYVDVFDGPEFAGERRAVLEGLEVRLRIRVIIGYVRAGMGLVDAEPRVQPGDGIRCHGGSAVGVDRLRRDPSVSLDGVLDEFFREGSVLGRPGLPVNGFPGVDVDDDVQQVPYAAGGSFQFRDVPGPYLVRAVSHQLGFLLRRVGGLGAALPGLAALAQQPVHCGLRAQVDAAVQQDRVHLAGGLVGELRRVQHRENVRSLVF